MLRTSTDERRSPAERERDIGAFIDLGTNSARLVLVRFEPDGGHTVLSQLKEVVRLGEDEFIDHHLQRAAMQRAAMVLKQFVDMARSAGAGRVDAIATCCQELVPTEADRAVAQAASELQNARAPLARCNTSTPTTRPSAKMGVASSTGKRSSTVRARSSSARACARSARTPPRQATRPSCCHRAATR